MRVYYKFSKDHDPRTPRDSEEERHIDVLYTVVPGPNPRIQRAPIVKSRAFDGPGELVIVDVALDAQRCFVLLQPLPSADSRRIPGRKGIDLFLADCAFKAGRLEYGKPHQIGITDGLLVYFDGPRVTLHGDTVVVMDRRKFVRQVPNPKRERNIDTERYCVRLFSGQSAGALEQINSFCALKEPDRIWVDPIRVSPNARFILFEGPVDPAIVGRDYRNDGSGPNWFTHGE
jgi:hypothetical protein